MDIYRREQVSHVWHVEPEGRTLEVFRLDAQTQHYLHAAVWRGDMSVRAEPFDAIELELGALWAE